MHVGITGHQRLEDLSAWSWIEFELGRVLSELPLPLIGVTSLAIGADQLFAALVLGRGGALHVVVPFQDYERTFEDLDLATYRELLHRARYEILASRGSDEDAYLAAGERVVDLSSVMIAVWDGQPARGIGGTADIVQYARRCNKRVVQLDPYRRAVQNLIS